jgi:DNA-binding transcriptional ArsR family regulator
MDWLRDVPANEEMEVLKRRIADLEKENAELRAKLPRDTGGSRSADANRVLVHLFRASEIEERDVGVMSRALGMEVGVVKYHLDQLKSAGLADVTGGNYVHGHIYWALTPAGRKYVVERNLI